MSFIQQFSKSTSDFASLGWSNIIAGSFNAILFALGLWFANFIRKQISKRFEEQVGVRLWSVVAKKLRFMLEAITEAPRLRWLVGVPALPLGLLHSVSRYVFKSSWTARSRPKTFQPLAQLKDLWHRAVTPSDSCPVARFGFRESFWGRMDPRYEDPQILEPEDASESPSNAHGKLNSGYQESTELNERQDTVYICLEDDACGVAVSRETPVIIYKSTDQNTADLADYLVRSTLDQDTSQKFCCAIIASRMEESQIAYDNFRWIVYEIAAAFERHGFTGKLRWGIRTDSCLRIHYRSELEAVRDALVEWNESSFDADIFVPANTGERRVTNYGVQYAAELNSQSNGAALVPIHKTCYATHFRNFEYSTSNLARWIEAKTKDEPAVVHNPAPASEGWVVKRREVHLVDIDRLRSTSPSEIAKGIALDLRQRAARVVVFDADEDADLNRIEHVIRLCETSHKLDLLLHAGTSLTALLAGNKERLSLSGRDIEEAFPNCKGAGVIVAGSMTARTDAQILEARNFNHAKDCEIRGRQVANQGDYNRNRDRVAESIKSALSELKTPIVFTQEFNESNELTSYQDKSVVRRMRNLLSEICGMIPIEDESASWILLKGSDTALDCLINGLGVSKLKFLGSCDFAKGVHLCRAENGKGRINEVPIFICAGNSGTISTIFDLLSEMASPD